MKRLFKRAILFLLLVFILPAMVSFAVWQAETNRPANWHSANWNTANLLPKPKAQDDQGCSTLIT